MAAINVELQSSILAELQKVAAREGTTIDMFVNVAIAEKLAVLRTEEFFRERAKEADDETLRRLLSRKRGIPPREGDELPPGYERD